MSSSRGYSGDRLELTPRMRAVLAAAAAGRSELETARELGVGITTVRSLRQAARARLGDAPNVTAAVWRARDELELL